MVLVQRMMAFDKDELMILGQLNATWSRIGNLVTARWETGLSRLFRLAESVKAGCHIVGPGRSSSFAAIFFAMQLPELVSGKVPSVHWNHCCGTGLNFIQEVGDRLGRRGLSRTRSTTHANPTLAGLTELGLQLFSETLANIRHHPAAVIVLAVVACQSNESELEHLHDRRLKEVLCIARPGFEWVNCALAMSVGDKF
jgi:hypothetical protein